MRIVLDLKSIPPIATLAEPDDFGRFEVAAERPGHATIAAEELRRLAGARAADPEWQSNLEKMLAYADSKGWIEADGSIRAHIEWD